MNSSSYSPWILLMLITSPAAPAAQTSGFQECNNVLYTLTGSARGDQFGWVSSNVPDVDGDGIQELLVSAPFFGSGGSGVGQVYLYSGADGSELFRFSGRARGENLGFSVAPAGDLDQDGIGDLLLGAPFLATRKGHARVVSGADGTQLYFVSPGQVGDSLGTAVSSAGDVNGDGWEDLALGAPMADISANNAGRVYIVSGQDGTSVLMSFDGQAAGDQFGASVGLLGDVTGDGLPELAIGAINGGPGNRGQVDLFDLQTGQVLYSKTPDVTGLNFSRFFLYSMGDVNNDGWPDLYVSDFSDAGGAGKAYIYDGPSGALLWKLSGQGGDGFGIGRPAGDVDGDGHGDMLLGSFSNSTGAAAAGQAEVFSGRTGQVLRTITSTTQGENLGFDAHGMGDLNGDGRPDFALTAASFNSSRGRVYVVAGGQPVRPLGVGLAGSGGFTPSLALQGCPRPGTTLTIQVTGALGGAQGCLLIGSAQVDMPAFGGTVYTMGDVLALHHMSSGAPGVPGAGGFSRVENIPLDPLLVGQRFYVQVGYVDPGAPRGVSLSAALAIEGY